MVIGLGLVPVLVWVYWPFRVAFARFAIRYLGLILILGLLYMLVFAQVGTGLGLHLLFWNEYFWSRVSASLGATLLLGLLGIIAYYLDPYPVATGEQTAAWLRHDEQIKAVVARWWGQRLGRISGAVRRRVAPVARFFRGDAGPSEAVAPAAVGDGSPQGPASAEVQGPNRLDRIAYALNAALFDWSAVLPIQAVLEPRTPYVRRLQRFLRTARTPFLSLLMAPAILPGIFRTHLPLEGSVHGPTVRTASLLWSGLAGPAGRQFRIIDGIIAWQLGILLGVLIIKVLLRVAERFHRNGEVARVEGVLDRGLADCPLGADCPAPGCTLARAAPRVAPPPGCLGRSKTRRSIAAFSGIVLAVYVAMGNIPFLYERVVSPAFAICAALGVLAMAYAAIASQPRSRQVPLVALLIAWLGFANHDRFKNRFEFLSYDESNLVPLHERIDALYFDGGGGSHPDLGESPEPSPVGTGFHVLAVDPDLVPDATARTNWLTFCRAPQGPGRGLADIRADQVTNGRTYADEVPDQPRPKLVVMCTSGGAARAAFWTATVLERVEAKIPGFGSRVRIITGASGGMLGASCYVLHRRDRVLNRADFAVEPGDDPRRRVIAPMASWADAVPTDGMTPLAKYIALSEIWQALTPFSLSDDRGVVLERAWENPSYPWANLRRPLRNLRPLERMGRIPSLIFSPMIVEDGRLLLISNLDLGADEEGHVPLLIKAKGGMVGDTTEEGKVPGDQINDYSLSAVEFFRLFPEAQGLNISTAVRMSATFPYVSPAVNLPTEPPRRVVDAGYYDNYGIQVATSWIYQNRHWLAENTSGVLLLQIRASVSVRDRLGVDDSPESWWSWATRGFQFLSSPIDGVMAARYHSSSFRNNKDVAFLSRWFADWMRHRYGADHPGPFFTTVVFENSATVPLRGQEVPDPWSRSGTPLGGAQEVPLTWYLTQAEIRAIRGAIAAEPTPGAIAAIESFARASDPERFARTTRGLDPAGVRREAIRLFIEHHRGQLKAMEAGPARDALYKRIEHLRNYQRLENLSEWWRTTVKRAESFQ
jgi:hypothetical protein